MNKKSIIAIEKIINNIMELDIITNGRDDNYFYDSYEMPIICGLVDDIDLNVKKISSRIIKKYNNVNWNVIDSFKEKDNGFMALKLGNVWKLADGVLKKELYNKLLNILRIELPIYYTNYCNLQHKKAIQKRNNTE